LSTMHIMTQQFIIIFSFYWSATKQKHTRLQITIIVIPCWVEQKTMNYGYCTASTWHAYCHKPLTKRVLSEHNGMCSLHVRYSETESWCMKKYKCAFITIGSENVNRFWTLLFQKHFTLLCWRFSNQHQ